MDKIDRLLMYVQKTNPSMTKNKLIEELRKSKYSTVGLILAWENSKDK